MKTKHTPGNWTHSDGSIYSESDPSGKDIATINKNGNTTEEEEHANGELIAAAPSILDALISLTEISIDADPIDFARAQREAKLLIDRITG